MSTGPAAPQPAATRTTLAPLNWVERLRERLPTGSWRRKLYDILALPVDEPTEFVTDEATLSAELTPAEDDEDKKAARAAEILAEAQSIFARAEDRAEGATIRATTLQGAVAIAASLLVAGAALVIGQVTIQGAKWIAVFAVLLVAATVALVMSGVRALSATSTIHRWHRPTATDIVRRSQLPLTEARVQLAAETLIDYGYNTKIAAWKVAYLGAAAWWFRIALALLVALAVFIGSYAIFGSPAKASIVATGSAKKSACAKAKNIATTHTKAACSKQKPNRQKHIVKHQWRKRQNCHHRSRHQHHHPGTLPRTT